MKLNYFSAVLLSLLTLTGCPDPSPNPKELYHFYFILTPTNPERAKLAQKFIFNAQSDGSNGEKTQVIFPMHNYTVVEICDRNTPDFMTSNISIQDVNNLDSVTQKAEQSLKPIVGETRSCKATAPSLVEITKNLNQAASNPQNKKMIIFLQAPWSRSEVTDGDLKELNAAIDRLAATGKVERLVLFNLNPDGADRLSKSFQGLKNKVVPANDGIGQVVEYLKSVRTDYLKSENK